jgi:LCP family protein required for cell wall assembly
MKKISSKNKEFIKRIMLSIWLMAILASASGCNLIEILDPQNRVAIAQSGSLVTANPNASATATPFQPLGPTATPTITLTPTITQTPTPTEVIYTNTPTPWYQNGIPDYIVNIMIMGNDWRPSSGYRTDVMILLSINKKTKTVNAISFPRDLYVQIPWSGNNRLNVVQPMGGFDLFADTMDLNFKVRPDYYVMTNFNGFVSIIDTLGGIDVYSANGLSDTCDLPQAINGMCSVSPGLVHMNGATTLWYARSRYTSNDFWRNRRQQEIMKAVLDRMLSFDVITKAPSLYSQFQNSVETNLDLGTITSLLPIAVSLRDSGNINRYYIDTNYGTPSYTESGAWVLVPNVPAIQDLIRRVVYDQP